MPVIISQHQEEEEDDALENVDNEICPWWWSQQTKYSHVCIVYVFCTVLFIVL